LIRSICYKQPSIDAAFYQFVAVLQWQPQLLDIINGCSIACNLLVSLSLRNLNTMLRSKFLTCLWAALFAFTLAVACSPSTTPSGGSSPTSAIPIGVAVAQTSNVALLGQEQVIGAKIAEKYFNDQGGINGRPIQLIFQDTAGDEQGAIMPSTP
jgi:Periplasmic binding protein